MLFSLCREPTAELRPARSEVAGKADELHDGILIDRLALPADRDEVAIPVRTEEEVIGADRVHVVRRRTRTTGGVGRIPGRAGDLPRNTAARQHIRREAAAEELEFRPETSTGAAASGVGRDALDGLQRLHVEG